MIATETHSNTKKLQFKMNATLSSRLEGGTINVDGFLA